MAEISVFDYASAQAILTTENVVAHASEIHGVITGLVCGGHRYEDDDYITIINDLFNNGEGLSLEVKRILKQFYGDVWRVIIEDSYGFQPVLPDDDDTIAERSHGISVWVQGFNLGLGLQQKNQQTLTQDVQEVLKDFAEIANLSDEVEEDEANEQAFYEVVEYVRISAMLVFAELGLLPDDKPKSATLH